MVFSDFFRILAISQKKHTYHTHHWSEVQAQDNDPTWMVHCVALCQYYNPCAIIIA